MTNKEEIAQAEQGCRHHGYKEWCNDSLEDVYELIHEIAHQFFRLGKYSGNASDTCFSDNYEKIIEDIKNVYK